jgi:hypothetical protein
MEFVIQSWGSEILFVMDYTLEQKRFIWVVGTLERLGGLGYFNEIGYRVDEDCVSLYWELDDIRDYLFDKEEEIFVILLDLLSESNIVLEDIREFYNLVIDYKNNRNKVFAYGMNKLVGV